MGDKLKHFLACFIIAAFSLFIMNVFFDRQWYGWDAGITAILIIILSVGKEYVWDKWLKRGTFEFMDIFWGIVGGWSMIFMWKILDALT